MKINEKIKKSKSFIVGYEQGKKDPIKKIEVN